MMDRLRQIAAASPETPMEALAAMLCVALMLCGLMFAVAVS